MNLVECIFCPGNKTSAQRHIYDLFPGELRFPSYPFIRFATMKRQQQQQDEVITIDDSEDDDVICLVTPERPAVDNLPFPSTVQESVDMSVQIGEGVPPVLSNSDLATANVLDSDGHVHALKHTTTEAFDVIVVLDKMERFRNSDGRTSGGERWRVFGGLLESSGAVYEPRVLPCGDALFIARNRRTGEEQVLDYIIERKTIDDYASSVKDGRLTKQAFLLRQTGIKNRMLVIEGDITKLTRQHSNDPQIHKKLADLEVSDGFHVVYTNDISETVSFYTSIHNRLQSRFENQRSSATEAFVAYDTWVERMKTFSSGITLQQLFVMQLCQTPGVGDRRARAITAAGHDTMQKLHCAYKRLDGKPKEQETMLAGINGVGGAASKTLFKLFTKSDYGTVMAPSSNSRSASVSRDVT